MGTGPPGCRMPLNFGDCNATVVAMPGTLNGTAVVSAGEGCSSIAVGVPGPSTGGGPVTGSLLITGTAAVPLSGHAAVYRRPDGLIDYASADNTACMNEAIWITIGAASAGDDVTAVMYGELSEPSWAWTPGVPIFLGLAGALTQTPPTEPTADFLAVLGYAPIPTKMCVNRQPSIDLI